MLVLIAIVSDDAAPSLIPQLGGGVLFVTASRQQTIIWSDQDTMLSAEPGLGPHPPTIHTAQLTLS